ncbi:hypothetical protein ABKN59_003988 [Abortiporus biennis]
MVGLFRSRRCVDLDIKRFVGWNILCASTPSTIHQMSVENCPKHRYARLATVVVANVISHLRAMTQLLSVVLQSFRWQMYQALSLWSTNIDCRPFHFVDIGGEKSEPWKAEVKSRVDQAALDNQTSVFPTATS